MTTDSKRELTAGEMHMLRIIQKGADADGWAPVSARLFKLVETMPRQLVELEPVGNDGAGRVRFTQEGQNVLNAAAWLGVAI